MARLLTVALLVGASAGCFNRVERQLDERVTQMEQHVQLSFDALEAIRDGDDGAYRDAMRSLGTIQDVPATQGNAYLEAMRLQATAAVALPDRPSRATATVGLFEHCQRCHALNGVRAVASPDRQDPLHEAVIALLWQDSARWTSNARKLDPSGALSKATDWHARKAALASHLAR